jgi:ABC-type antimicrobial peptide transport system permease subunit
MWETAARDLWLAARGLARSASFTVVAVKTYAAVAVGLIGVAAFASWLPARRASAVDPAESLAAE